MPLSRSRITDRRARTISAGLAGTGMVLMLVGGGPALATPDHDDEGHKVTICHATSSDTNPYVENTVDVASILGTKGHDGHDGDVWYAGHPQHWDWGDIIPAFDFGPGEQYAGQNVAAGAAFTANHCGIPGTSTTSSSTSTTIDGGGGSSTSTTEPPTTTSTTEPPTTTSTTEPPTTSTTEPPTTSTTEPPTTSTTEPPTTSTTEPPTTSTTEPPTTSTTEPPTTSTTIEDDNSSTTSTTGASSTTQLTIVLDASGETTVPTVVEDASGLPRTGIDGGLLVGAGAALLLAALGTLGLARRADPAIR